MVNTIRKWNHFLKKQQQSFKGAGTRRANKTFPPDTSRYKVRICEVDKISCENLDTLGTICTRFLCGSIMLLDLGKHL